MDYRKYISKALESSIYPTLRNLVEYLAGRIEKAINSKENPTHFTVDNPTDIEPIVEAQKQTIQAIKDIPSPVIPETDMKPLEAKIEALITALEKKEMTVNVGKTEVNVDNKSVVKAIEKLRLEIPEMNKQEVIDYTLMLDEMMKIMERPKDHTEIKKLQSLVKKLGTSEDLSVIAEWLKVIAEKSQPEFPKLNFDEEGNLKVAPNKLGGGGGGLTALETGYLKEIAENTATIEVSVGDVDVNTDGMETLQTATNTKLDTLNGKVATEAKQDTIISNQTEQITLLKNGANIPEYDYREINYVMSGNLPIGILSIVFKKDSVTVATVSYAEVSNELTVISKV